MKRIEYIELSRQCWFDTGIVPDIDTEVECWIAPNELTYNWAGFFGSQSTDDGPDSFQVRKYSNTDTFVSTFDSQNTQSTHIPYTTGVTSHITLNKTGLTVDETIVSLAVTAFTTQPTYSIYINAIHNPSWSGQYYRSHTGKYGEFIIRKSGVAVADFIPVIDENDVACYYDTVGQTYIYNQGTGTTIAGPLSFGPDKSQVSFNAVGGTDSVTMVSDTTWTATTSANWVTLSQTAGTSSDTAITITCSTNWDSARTATVTFTDGESTASMTINQSTGAKLTPNKSLKREGSNINRMFRNGVPIYNKLAYKPSLEVNTTTLTFWNTGSSVDVTVTSDAPYTFTTDAEWLTLTGTDSGFTATAGAYTGETSRSATITVTANNGDMTNTLTITATQYTVKFVDCIYVETVPSTWDYLINIDTGLYPDTGTTMRVNYYGRGIFTDRIVGTVTYEETDYVGDRDNNDYRYFSYNGSTLDIMAGRQTNRNYDAAAAVEHDVTVGNFFAYNNLTDSYIINTTAQSTLRHNTIHVDIGYCKIKSLVITTGGVVVFDGHAAVLGNTVGLFDTVTGQMFTNANYTITYEE